MRTAPRWMAAVALLALGGVAPVAAQTASPITIPTSLESTAAPAVPFSVGERLEYQLKLGAFSVGSAWMAVESIDSIRGAPSYHFSLGLDGSALFGALQIHDRYYSWMDVRKLASRRYIRVIDQPGYDSYREFEIYPEEHRWERTDEFDDKTGESPSDAPLDEIAFIYFLRTLPLEVGETYTFDNYFKEDGNPVTVEVARREERKTPAGTFQTIVVRPIIKTSGLFGEGGEAELYFTDDEARHLVYLRSSVPGFRSISIHLRSVDNGTVESDVGAGG